MKILWEIGIGITYMACYIIDPVIFAFNYQPLLYAGMNLFQEVMTYLIVVDMFTNFVTGFTKEDESTPTEQLKREDSSASEALTSNSKAKRVGNSSSLASHSLTS